jgi:hypothetical protein
MIDLQSLLKEHIDSVQEKEAVFGVDDCSPWCGSWVEKATGVRVIEPDWHSWPEAEAKIKRAGSLCALWDEALADHYDTMWPTGTPIFGDVGIIETRIAGQVSGIFLDHGRFVWRVKVGVSILQPRNIVKVWTFQR